ncbi:MAG: hypothetical protein ACI87E_001305 [Mariniblastus sp.]|jgi:hypothetical protein
MSWWHSYGYLRYSEADIRLPSPWCLVINGRRFSCDFDFEGCFSRIEWLFDSAFGKL